MKLNKILIFILLTGTLISCSDNIAENVNKTPVNNIQIVTEQKVEKNNLKTVSVEEFKKELEKKDGVLIDLRTNQETAEGVIPGAKQIDYYASDFKEKLNSLDKNKKYLIYCRSGARSGRTLDLMKDLGFTNVINLYGGINSWVYSGEKLGILGEETNINNKTISLEEVQKHSKSGDCYTILDGKVYDVSSFFGKHPGGDENLLKVCGKDATEIFNNQHGYNEKAKMKKEEFFIGNYSK